MKEIDATVELEPIALTEVGAPGTNAEAGVTEVLAVLAGLVPVALVAVTENV